MTTQKCARDDCNTLCHTVVTQPDNSLCRQHVKPLHEIDPNGEYVATYNGDGSISFEFRPSPMDIMARQQEIYQSFGGPMTDEEIEQANQQLRHLEEVKEKLYGKR